MPRIGVVQTTGVVNAGIKIRGKRIKPSTVRTLPPGHVLVAAMDSFPGEDPPQIVCPLMPGEAPTLTGGYAQWDVIDRPARTGVVEFRGQQPLQMDLPLFLNGWATPGRHKSVEGDIKDLEIMAKRAEGETRPPVLLLQGPVPRPDLRWVINGFQWGEAVWSDLGDPRRFRQPVVVRLLEFTTDTTLISSSAARKARAKAVKQSKTTTVRSGEDRISDVVKRYYGRRDPQKNIDVAAANGIRVLARLRVGRRLKMP